MTAPPELDVEAVRERFSSLGPGFSFFDAPGGTQVPDEVGVAMAAALREASGNLGAPYETGRRVEQILATAKAAAGQWLGCDPGEVVFGANMTTLDFALARTLARDLKSGDEIVVTRLDHDGGVAPWVELGADLGLEIRQVNLLDDLTLDYDDLERKLSERTRVVAFAWASNAVGVVTDAARVCSLAHEAGALAWIDAVHYAAHEPVDVRAIGADVLFCSAYKWCGPHLGMAYVRREVAERWRPFKARPSPSEPIGRRFETGTPPFELLAGLTATVEYMESIGGLRGDRPLRAGALRALPRRAARRRRALRPEDAELARRDLPRQRHRQARCRGRRAPGRARLRRLASRQLVLARAEAAAALRGRVGPDRAIPLQHRRRGGRAAWRAGRAGAVASPGR